MYWGLGYTNIEALRINEALMASQKGMDIFARLGERERWARVAGNHAHCLMVKGKLAPAVALLDEIAGAAAGFVNPDAYLLVIGCCGWFRLLMKDPKEAAHFYRLGLDRSGFQLNIRPFMLEFLTLSELLMGNLAGAKRLAAENRVNDIFRSRIALYEGDWKAAEEKLERALDWAQTADTKWNQAIALINMVPLLRVAGDYERATAAFERARSLYPPDDLFLELGMRSQAVMLCVDSGRPERAAEHLECCRRILAEQEDWLGIAGPVWRTEGIVAALEGRSQESDDHFAKAIENHRQYSLPWDEAETLHYWGRALLRQVNWIARRRDCMRQSRYTATMVPGSAGSIAWKPTSARHSPYVSSAMLRLRVRSIYDKPAPLGRMRACSARKGTSGLSRTAGVPSGCTI